MTTVTVTLYIDNRLDQTVEIDVQELAAEFVQAARAGLKLVQRGSVEFAYRWWLSGSEGRHSSWDEGEWNALVQGLIDYFDANPGTREFMWEQVCP